MKILGKSSAAWYRIVARSTSKSHKDAAETTPTTSPSPSLLPTPGILDEHNLPNVLAIFVVRFHHINGPEIETVCPPELQSLAACLGIPLLDTQSTDVQSETKSFFCQSATSDSSQGMTLPVIPFFGTSSPVRRNWKSVSNDEPVSEREASSGSSEESDFCSAPITLGSIRRRVRAQSNVEMTFPQPMKGRMFESQLKGLVSLYVDLLTEIAALPFLALPDLTHQVKTGHTFLTIPLPSGRPLFGLTCYRMKETRKTLIADASSNPRAAIQKAICVISKAPCSAHVLLDVKECIHSLCFSKASDLSATLRLLYNRLNRWAHDPRITPSVKEVSPDPRITDEVYSSFSKYILASGLVIHPFQPVTLTSILPLLERMSDAKSAMIVLKSVILEKKVIIFGDNAAVVSSLAMFFASCLPVNPVRKCLHLQPFKHKGAFLPYAPLGAKDTISKLDSFLIGTTNPVYLNTPCDILMVAMTVATSDHVVQITCRNRVLKPALVPSEFELSLMRGVDEMSKQPSPLRRRGQGNLLTSNHRPAVMSEVPADSDSEEVDDSLDEGEDWTLPDEAAPTSLQLRRKLDQVVARLSSSRSGSPVRPPRIGRFLQISTASAEVDSRRPPRLKLPQGFDAKDVLPGRLLNALRTLPMGHAKTESRDVMYHRITEAYFELFFRLIALAAGPTRSLALAEAICMVRGFGLNNFRKSFVRAWLRTKNADEFISDHQFPTVASFRTPPRLGYARCTYANGDVYSGNYKHGLRNGFGSYTSKNGVYYVGEWLDDKRHGFGRFSHSRFGYSYVGGWKDDKKQGQGVISSMKGKYWGEFRANVFKGQGTWMDLVSGSVYQGEFSNNEFHGVGNRVTSRDQYSGMWAHGQHCGAGVLMLADGTVYDGQFKAGLLDGPGRACYSDGCHFFGTWADGKRSELGIFSMPLNYQLSEGTPMRPDNHVPSPRRPLTPPQEEIDKSNEASMVSTELATSSQKLPMSQPLRTESTDELIWLNEPIPSSWRNTSSFAGKHPESPPTLKTVLYNGPQSPVFENCVVFQGLWTDNAPDSSSTWKVIWNKTDRVYRGGLVFSGDEAYLDGSGTISINGDGVLEACWKKGVQMNPGIYSSDVSGAIFCDRWLDATDPNAWRVVKKVEAEQLGVAKLKISFSMS